LGAIIISAICLVTGWAFTDSWGRGVSHAIGFPTVWALITGVRAYRMTPTEVGNEEPRSQDDDWKPPLFGNG